MVGAVVVAVSGIAAFVAALFLSHPRWGIPAAVGLAVACVGVAVGALLLRKVGWADTTPPSDDRPALTLRRLRRQSMIFGILLLAVGAASAIGIVTFGEGRADRALRLWTLCGLSAAAGAVLLVVAFRRPPAAVTESDRPSHPAAADAAGWVRVGASGHATSWANLATVAPPFVIPLAAGLILPGFLRDGVLAPVFAVVGVIALVIAGAIVFSRTATPFIAADAATLRRGSRLLPATEVVAASLAAAPWVADATQRSLTVTFHSAGKMSATIALRDRGRLALTEDETALLSSFVERTSIELPRDKEDPRGRFSRVLYPSHLTKTDTLALVADPPGDGDALPAGPPV